MESLKSFTISTGVLGANTVFRFFLETFQTGDPDNKRDRNNESFQDYLPGAFNQISQITVVGSEIQHSIP